VKSAKQAGGGRRQFFGKAKGLETTNAPALSIYFICFFLFVIQCIDVISLKERGYLNLSS